MINLIVFTKIDAETKKGYFNNLLGKGFVEEDDFIIETGNILFVSDMITNPGIEKIGKFAGGNSENRIYVIYHETSPKLKRQRAYIQSCFNNNALVEYIDHHNKDGLHFEYISKASAYYISDYDRFLQEIALLTDRLNGNTATVNAKNREEESTIQSKIDLLYHCLHPDTRIKAIDFYNQWGAEKEIGELIDIETSNQFDDGYLTVLRELRDKLLREQ